MHLIFLIEFTSCHRETIDGGLLKTWPSTRSLLFWLCSFKLHSGKGESLAALVSLIFYAHHADIKSKWVWNWNVIERRYWNLTRLFPISLIIWIFFQKIKFIHLFHRFTIIISLVNSTISTEFLVSPVESVKALGEVFCDIDITFAEGIQVRNSQLYHLIDFRSLCTVSMRLKETMSTCLLNVSLNWEIKSLSWRRS